MVSFKPAIARRESPFRDTNGAGIEMDDILPRLRHWNMSMTHKPAHRQRSAAAVYRGQKGDRGSKTDGDFPAKFAATGR